MNSPAAKYTGSFFFWASSAAVIVGDPLNLYLSLILLIASCVIAWPRGFKSSKVNSHIVLAVATCGSFIRTPSIR
jgi:hypothetical protein